MRRSLTVTAVIVIARASTAAANSAPADPPTVLVPHGVKWT